MKKIETEEQKKLQMQILDYVDAFCRANGIHYTLSGGTLLGAIRHGGFIPWDDDIDIQMLRSEYESFTNLWNLQKEHSFYELVNVESNNNMGYPFAKIYHTDTITYVGKVKRTGVFIDVFPIDKVVDDHDFSVRRKHIMKLLKRRSWVFRLLGLLPSSKMLYDVYCKIAVRINRIAQKEEEGHCYWAFEMCSGMLCKAPMPISVFDSFINIPFEDRTYMAVKNYDTYLTATFGDYMTLPPEEKRVSHHGFVAYWKE